MSEEAIKLPDYYRFITDKDIEPVKPNEPVGPVISMRWIPIEKLVVDTRYQRDILTGIKSNVRQIAIRFKWRNFAPVIVTKIEGTEYYAIIDGQHRTTSAYLRTLKEVPCAIVDAKTLEEQGDSFKSLNANTTKVLIYDIFKADLASNEPYAKNYQRVAKLAGITLVPSNRASSKLKQGECKSYKAFEACLKKYQEAILIRSCRILSGNDSTKGILNSNTIGSVCELLKRNASWRENYDVEMIFKHIDFKQFLSEASGLYRLENSTHKAVLTRILYNHVSAKLQA